MTASTKAVVRSLSQYRTDCFIIIGARSTTVEDRNVYNRGVLTPHCCHFLLFVDRWLTEYREMSTAEELVFFSVHLHARERESVASSNDFVAHAAFLAPTDGQNVASRLEAWRPALVLVYQSNHTDWSHGRIKTKSGLMLQQWRRVPYDTRCYFNVRSKADISQLNLPHGTDN